MNSLISVDIVVKELKTTRSAFAREALREALHRYQISRLEEKHRMGYTSHPTGNSEFSIWEDEQDWAMNETRGHKVV